MQRCHSCNAVVPRASWTMEEFSEALKTFRKDYLAAWAIANKRTLDEAYEENRSRDAASKELLGGELEEVVSEQLRAIATSRPRVAWLCDLPRKDREWWRAIPHGLEFLVRTYPEVEEEEWRAVLQT